MGVRFLLCPDTNLSVTWTKLFNLPGALFPLENGENDTATVLRGWENELVNIWQNKLE